MHKTLKLAAKWIVIAELIVGLLPLTAGFIMLILIGVMSLGAIIFGSDKIPTIEIAGGYLLISLVVALVGYGLFSLWWLSIKYAKISIKQIPRYVICGLIIGGSINILMIVVPFIPGLVFPAGRFLPLFLKSAILYTAPLIILSTTVVSG